MKSRNGLFGCFDRFYHPAPNKRDHESYGKGDKSQSRHLETGFEFLKLNLNMAKRKLNPHRADGLSGSLNLQRGDKSQGLTPGVLERVHNPVACIQSFLDERISPFRSQFLGIHVIADFAGRIHHDDGEDLRIFFKSINHLQQRDIILSLERVGDEESVEGIDKGGLLGQSAFHPDAGLLHEEPLFCQHDPDDHEAREKRELPNEIFK